MQKKKIKIKGGGKELVLEVSELAEQANAAVLARYGETAVLVTAVMSKAETILPYLPLKVDYEERFYAAGKIIGSRFIRREGRPPEDAVLAGRLVDRVIRPLFDHRLRRDIQVVVTVLAYDEEQDPDFPGLIAASLALGLSDIPWDGPVGGVRIAKIGEEFVVAPPNSELKKETRVFETFAAGPRGKISMIELGGREASEADVLRGFELAQKEIDRLIDFEESIIKEAGKPKAEVMRKEASPELKAALVAYLSDKLEAAVYPHLSPGSER